MTCEDWWDKNGLGKPLQDNERSTITILDIAKAAWNASRYNLQVQGQDEPCFYCGERCDGYAGNPSKWPLIFCHPDGTGIARIHHTGCVEERLFSTRET